MSDRISDVSGWGGIALGALSFGVAEHVLSIILAALSIAFVTPGVWLRIRRLREQANKTN